MPIIFCSECGYRTYTTPKSLSQEFCTNCGKQGTMKELKVEIKERI